MLQRSVCLLRANNFSPLRAPFRLYSYPIGPLKGVFPKDKVAKWKQKPKAGGGAKRQDSRTRISEQNVVFGGLKSNLGIQKSPWEQTLEEENEEQNALVFEHIQQYFEKSGLDFGTEQWLDLRDDLFGFPFRGKVDRRHSCSCSSSPPRQ